MSVREAQVALTAAERARAAVVEQLAKSGAGGVDGLIELLADPSWPIRRRVVAALGSLGAPAVGPLCEVLRTRRDDEARIAATVDALVASSADVLGAIELLAVHANPAIVADVAQVLGRRGQTSAVPLLAKLVEHADDNVAVAAIEGLGRIGGPRAVDTVIAAAQSNEFFRVFPAIDVLGRGGDPRSIAPLTALVGDPTYTPEAARALGKTGEANAAPALVSLFGHASDAVVRIAVVALAELERLHRHRYGSVVALEAALARAPAEPAVVARLTRVLASANVDEQAAFAHVLGLIGTTTDAGTAALRGLLDVTGPVAEIAAASLLRLGRESDRLLAEALTSGTSERRRILLPVVGREAVAAGVALCLTDEDPLVRALACEALGRIGAVDHIDLLMPHLGDANARVVQAAISALQSLGSAKTITKVIAAAKSPSATTRRAALRILAYFGHREALPVFLGALEDVDPRAREVALTGLASLEDEPRALEALLETSRSEGPLGAPIRRAALRALGQSIADDGRIAERLAQALSDPDAWARYYACQALGKLGLSATAPSVAERLHDEAGQVRIAAIEAISHFDTRVAEDALRAAATSDDADMRRAALVGLGNSRNVSALPVLFEAARSDDAATRLVAISAIAELAMFLSDTGGAPLLDPLDPLEAAASDADENVRAAALVLLARSPSPRATPILVELARKPEERDRIVELLSTPSRSRVPALLASLALASDDEALLLTSALSRLQTPEAEAALFAAMSFESPAVRRATAASVASLNTAAGRAALRVAAEHDLDPEVRRVCAALSSR